ncbi:MAG: NAD(P)H-dependent oxidoreductase subunit E [Actinomycetota bacterium]|nr:NAD(P)H-dependent oxidoreductase subunit E [Actinomycetota bacterium]
MTRIPVHGDPKLGPPENAERPHEPKVLTGDLRRTAEAIVARYPNSRSAALPLLFLVQSKEGYVTDEGMRDVADILSLTPADVLSTGSFYTMLKKRPTGQYLISICRNISCTHLGARKIIADVEEHLGIDVGETTPDGKITLEAAECLATCDGAPSLQVNYEDFYDMDVEKVILLVEKLRRGDPVLSSRGQVVRTHTEISRETATVGLRGGSAGEQVEATFGGESHKGQDGPGFRPKEPGGAPRPGDGDE